MPAPIVSPRELRAQFRRTIRWTAGSVTFLVLLLVTLSSIVAQSPLRAERERTFIQQARLVTTNLAASLVAPQSAASEQRQADGVIQVDAQQLRAALGSYQRLSTIHVVSEALSVLASAGRDATSAADLLGALRLQAESLIPPADDDIAVVRQPGRLVTAGRILDQPGTDGPLVLLEFRVDSGYEVARAVLIGVAAATIFGLFIWTSLDQILRIAVLAPLLKLIRIERRMFRGNWTLGITGQGSREIQQLFESRRQAGERAARLWQTIQWRVRFLERVAPGKAIEAAHIAGRAAPFHQFGTSSPATRTESQPIRIAVIGSALVCELTAQLGLMFVYWESMTTLLACFGSGLIAGAAVAIKPPTSAASRTVLTISIAVLALSHLMSAIFVEQSAALAAGRLLGGFGLALAVRLALAIPVASAPPYWLRTYGTPAKVVSTVMLVALAPALVLGAMNYQPESVLLVLAAVCALGAVALWAHALWYRRSVPPEPSSSRRPDSPVATSHPKTGFNLRSLLSVILVAIAILHAIALCAISTDFSGRFLGLVLMLIALVTGAGLPQSFGPRACWVAFVASGLVVAPAIIIYQFTSLASEELILIALAPPLGLTAGSAFAWMSYHQQGRRPLQPASAVRDGLADPIYQHEIMRLGAGFVLAALLEYVVESAPPPQIIASAVIATIIGLFVGYSPRPGRSR